MTLEISSLKLDHDSYIALHIQLHNTIRHLIISGRWQNGERIPGELSLAKHLNISRTTVRIALQRVEVEGLITRIPGRGTFVSHEPDRVDNTRTVGYVTRSFHNEIHRVLLSSVETELRSAGYKVIFSNARTHDEELDVLEQLLHDNLSGLVLWPNAGSTDKQIEMLNRYQERHIPVTFIDRKVVGVKADTVSCDHFGGTYTLIQHLIELGHRRIVYLTHNAPMLSSIKERERAYQTVMATQSLKPEVWRLNSPHANTFFETDLFELLDNSNVHFKTQISQMLQQTNPTPTAIVGVNDALAIIVMRTIRQLGLSVPDDISIVGFDDISLASYIEVPLTTVAQDAHTIGQRAAQSLLERFDGDRTPPKQLVVPIRLQIRMSTTTPIEEDQILSE